MVCAGRGRERLVGARTNRKSLSMRWDSFCISTYLHLPYFMDPSWLTDTPLILEAATSCSKIQAMECPNQIPKPQSRSQ